MLKTIKEKTRQLFVAILSIITVVSGLVPIGISSVAAAELPGELWVLETDHPTKIAWDWKGEREDNGATVHNYDYGGVTRFRLTDKNSGRVIQVFCFQNGVGTKTGTSYGDYNSSEPYETLPSDVKKKIEYANAWYRTYYGDNDYARAATQMYIWNLTSAEYYKRGTANQVKIKEGTGHIDWTVIQENTEYEIFHNVKSLYDEVDAYVEGKVSGNSVVNFGNVGTITLKPGTSYTLTDKNKQLHLAEYQINKTGIPAGIDIEKKGDSLEISVASNFTGTYEATINGVVEFLDLYNSNEYFIFATKNLNDENEVSQGLVYPGIKDPVMTPFKLKVASGKISVEKYDSISFEALAGAKFEVYDETDTKLATLITNADGVAETDWLPYGTYSVKEIDAPTGYNISSSAPKTVNLNATNTTVEFYDKPIQAAIRVEKYDEENPDIKLAGVVFEVHKIKGIESATYDIVVDTITTDRNGEGVSGLLDYGDYYLIEKETNYGYYNNGEKRYFNIRKEMDTITFSIGNPLVKSSVIVKKVDSNNDGYGTDANGNKLKLAGAEFELWEHLILRDVAGNVLSEHDAKVDGPIVTGTDGTASFDNQIAYSNELQQSGSYYYVKETKAPLGYKLNTEEHRIDFEYKNVPTVTMESTFENDPMKGKIKVVKVDKENNQIKLAGAVYEVRNNKGVVVDTITTDANGEALTKELRIGKYTIKEIKAPNNYQKDAADKVIELKAVEEKGEVVIKTPLVEFANTHDKGKLSLTKVDGLTVDYVDECTDENDLSTCKVVAKTTDDTVLLPGVSFAIYKFNDFTKPVATGVTDANGKFEVTLNTGKYYYQETKAPEGYNINPNLVLFEFKANGDVINELVANMVIYGKLKVRKIGEVLSEAKVNEEGITELSYEEKLMPGVKFELIAEEEILHPITKKVLYQKDEVVREIMTDENGEAEVTNLPLGKYYVKEITAPEEHSVYELTSDVKYIELTEENANFEGVVESEATFINERLTVKPSIYKVGKERVNEDDEKSELVLRPLTGAKFGIYNVEEINNITEIETEDGEIDIKSDDESIVRIAPDTLLAVMTSGDDGYANVEVKLPFGKYYVKELEAPEGYYIDEEKHGFELVWKQEMQDLRVLDFAVADMTNPLVNEKIYIPKTGIKDMTSTYIVIGIATIAVAGLALIIARKKED